MAKRRILKKLLRVLIVVAVLAIAIFAFSLFVMARKDKEHERFFNTGKSVNQFLATYKHGLEEASRRRMLPKSRNSIQTTMPLLGAAVGC